MTANHSFYTLFLTPKTCFFTSPSHSTLRLFLTLQGKVPDQYKMQVRNERYIANNLMKPNVFFFLSKKQYFQFSKY